MGEGTHRHTFWSGFLVKDALDSPHWVRKCNPGDVGPRIAGEWRTLEFQPKAILHSNHTVALPEDPMGMYGDVVQVIAQEAAVMETTTATVPDVSDIPTPTTPSMSEEEFPYGTQTLVFLTPASDGTIEKCPA